MYIRFIIGVVLLICSNCLAVSSVQQKIGPAIDNTKTLKLLHVVFRHGNRTPLGSYPTDPYANETYYPYGIGQITNEGKKLLFSTGKWLKHRYGHFLGKLYVSDAVWAQATDYPRTIMSTASLLAGLFSPNDTALEWNNRVNWQPIPIIAEPLNEDALLGLRSPCPRYFEAYNECYQLPEVKAYLLKNEQLFKELSYFIGYNITSPSDVQFFYGTLRSQKEFGLKLPKWTKQYYPHRLIQSSEMSFIFNMYTDELKKIVSGPFLKKIINDWLHKRNGTITPKIRKIFLYGGHDATIVNLFQSLNVWKRQIPDYGITAILELWQENSTGLYGVKIYTRTSPEFSPTPLTIPGCDHFCPLDQFIELTKDIIPENEEKECESNGSTPVYKF